MRLHVKNIIQDENGRVVLWQAPNALLWCWIALKAVTILLKEGRLQTHVEQLSMVVLFVWAVYELTTGVNYFRKFLGLIIASLVATSLFK